MGDRTYDFREIKTRIILRNDVASAWSSSNIVLEKGEPAIELDTTKKTGKLKFGDGSSKFSQLPFSTLTPDEVETLINQVAVTDVKTGTGADGTITITKNGTDTAVAVKGLKSAAYTESSAYATSAQGTKADNAMPKAGGTFTGLVTLSGAPTKDLHAATKKYVDDKVRTASSAVTTLQGQLKSAAYTESSDYATAAQGTKADNAMPKAGGTFTGAVTLSGAPTTDLQAATKKYVDDSITSALSTSDAMVFKGTVGTGGTVSNVADITNSVTGDTYKVITVSALTAAQSADGTTHDLSIGDLIIYTESKKWAYVPSGDEDVTTVQLTDGSKAITVNTTANTGSIVLGTAAGVNTATSVSNSTSTVPTSSAVKSYVDTAVGNVNSTEVILHNASNNINVNGTTASTGTVVFGTAAGVDTTSSLTVTGGKVTGSTTLPTGSAVAAAINAATDINAVTSVATGTEVFLAGVYATTDNQMVTNTSIKATRDATGKITKLDTTVTKADTSDKLSSAMSIEMIGGVTGSTTSTVSVSGSNQTGHGTDGSSNSGSFKVAITSVNTDYLENGSKTLILNGGTATE